MSKEWETRKKKIDKKLRQCGWKDIVEYFPGIEIPFKPFVVTEYQTKSGPADYILFVHAKPIAVIEAKRTSIDPYASLDQARRYSRDFSPSPYSFEGYRIPFIYSSNGDDVCFQDLRTPESRSREAFAFHTPDSLLRLFEFDESKARDFLSKTHCEDPHLRYYQLEAIKAVEEALLQNKLKMLVHMATGTGKSWMTPVLVYRFLKAGLFKRILYLVDRRALGKQERGFFAGYEPEPGLKFDKIYQVVSAKENVIPKNVDVYICTIQRIYSMLKGKEMLERVYESDDPWEWDPEDTPVDYNPNIPIDTFDCIISDECHRSIYNKWKVVLDYFDAVQIGFTATPAAHTYAYFDQNLVYKYPYEKAVKDEYLVDFDVANIATDITISGVTIPPGQPLVAKERITGQISEVFPQDELIFDSSEIERKITVIDRNRKLVDEISKRIKEDQKTLVFAVDDAHADQLVRLLREKYSHQGDRFVQKITYKADRPWDLIKEFRNRKFPVIAVTVDMLSTGIDIPAIENIVLVRSVKSYVLLWQIIGRGTRKSEGKSHFVIFDCAGVMDAFRNKDPTFDKLYQRSQSRDIREIVKQLRLKWRIQENIQHLKKKLIRVSKEIDPEAKPKFARFVPDADLESFAETLENRFEKNFGETISIFENEDFIKFLEDFSRKPRYFLIDEITRDEVIADEYLFYTIDGRSLKPEDYIKSFENFVKQNRDKIDAIKILLEKPRSLKVSTFRELRRILSSQPELFTEKRLRRSYKNELVDIITFIKHAVLAEPLVSPEERVKRAFQKLHERIKFTREQQDWLELIKAHLVQNVIIEQEDFHEIPFSRKGGWRAANRTFDFQLPTILDEINEMVIKT